MDNSVAKKLPDVQEIKNKISVALAIAILRSKPDNVFTASYILKVQEAILNEWKKSSTPDVFQNQLVSLQLIKVAQDVAQVVPDQPTVQFDDSPIVPLSAVHLEASLPPIPSPSALLNEDVIEQHGDLFRSLVQLKFAVDYRKTVPFDQVRKYIMLTQNLNKRTAPSTFRFASQSPKEYQKTDDSGVGTASKAQDSVSSSLFRSITNSFSVEVLITKTTESLMAYVRNAIFDHPFDRYYRWKGSLLEKTCLTLASALGDDQCRTIVTYFMEESINEIWHSDDLSKSFSFEHQLKLLSRLCVVSEVCSDVLNSVMGKFEEFAQASSQLQPPSPSNIHLVEKIPHFLQFAEIVFSAWKSRVFRCTDSNEKSVTSTVWKLRMEKQEVVFRTQSLLKSWRDTLEKLLVSCIEAHPLVNGNLLSTLAAVESLVLSSAGLDDENSSYPGDLHELS